MTEACYQEAITRVLASEGGYVNHPRDPGGPTNFGITLAVYRANGHSGATAADVKAMSRSEAERIYHLRYANPVGFDLLPCGLDYCVFDYGVNSGTGRATKVLRRVMGLPDNAPFAAVLAAINKRDVKAIIDAVCDERLKFLHGLRTWSDFGPGWTRRIRSVDAAALKMTATKTSTAQPDVVDVAPGKGVVPPPVIHTPTAAAGTISGAGAAMVWLQSHPGLLLAVLAGIAIVAIAGVVLYERWHATKQEAPTPGIAIVPEFKAA